MPLGGEASPSGEQQHRLDGVQYTIEKPNNLAVKEDKVQQNDPLRLILKEPRIMNGDSSSAMVPVSSAMELIVADVEGAAGRGIPGPGIDIVVSL